MLMYGVGRAIHSQVLRPTLLTFKSVGNLTRQYMPHKDMGWLVWFCNGLYCLYVLYVTVLACTYVLYGTALACMSCMPLHWLVCLVWHCIGLHNCIGMVGFSQVGGISKRVVPTTRSHEARSSLIQIQIQNIHFESEMATVICKS